MITIDKFYESSYNESLYGDIVFGLLNKFAFILSVNKDYAYINLQLLPLKTSYFITIYFNYKLYKRDRGDLNEPPKHS